MNESAFPIVPGPAYHAGMTLRDYFAAKAMQGALAGGRFTGCAACAADCYAIADAMLKERAK